MKTHRDALGSAIHNLQTLADDGDRDDDDNDDDDDDAEF